MWLARNLARGETLGPEISPGIFDITGRFVEDIDYCDFLQQEWIWSIGRELKTGRIRASIRAEFYLNDEFECLRLR